MIFGSRTKTFQTLLLLLFAICSSVLLSSCSGLIPSPFTSSTSPTELARLEGGGSLSTLWYQGSDSNYHYFVHLVKTSTRYRIPRNELHWEDELPAKSRSKAVLVTNQLSRALEHRRNEQGVGGQPATPPRVGD